MVNAQNVLIVCPLLNCTYMSKLCQEASFVFSCVKSMAEGSRLIKNIFENVSELFRVINNRLGMKFKGL